MLADITGSTPLYEDVGDAAALRQIGRCLDRLRTIVQRAGGTTIRSKGDDVLCFFADAPAALRAVRAMLAEHTEPLTIHAGMHFGQVIHARDDIFGDAVNVTARLAELAKPGEALVSRSVVERLSAGEAGVLRFLDDMTFKGRSAATAVYSLVEGDATHHTEVAPARAAVPGTPRDAAAIVVTLRHAGRARSCREGATLSIGRAADCDVVIGRQWVSRRHATVAVQRGKVQLSDRSTAGTYVAVRGGYAFFLHRETVVLTGSGVISPATAPTDPRAEAIEYEIAHMARDG